MKILVVNDDGIDSEGLRILAEWAAQFGETTVIAPKRQQSCQSMAINIVTPFEAIPSDRFPGMEAWSVDSTAADCVRFAVCKLQEQYDLVLAGINNGLNTGHDIAYSSTVAAITEAGFWKIPSIAISTETNDYSGSREILDSVKEYFDRHRLLEIGRMYNVNYPAPSRGCKGILITSQKDDAYFLDKYSEEPGSCVQAHGYSVYQNTADLSVDLDAVMNGYISITPMTADRTDREVLDKIR